MKIRHRTGTFADFLQIRTPSWQRAHPNRFIVHNGEINTIQRKCRSYACTRRNNGEHLYLQKMILEKIFPVVNVAGSDSAMLDNTLEFLVMSGMELPKAVMITIPEPWINNQGYEPETARDFYQYYSRP